VHPERAYPGAAVRDRLDEHSAEQVRVDAHRLVIALLGDDSTSNVFMVGVALQAGHVPIDPESVERAIELNGVAVQKNLAAFRWGRAWVSDRDAVEAAARTEDEPADIPLRERVVDEVDAKGFPALTDAVMRNLHKLMAYKDEYEVARLLLLPESKRQAARDAGIRKGKAKITWHLHPPALRSLGMKNKIKLGRSSVPVLATLRALKGLRGTPFDVFGYAKVRRIERAMVPEYIEGIRRMLPHVDDSTVDEAVLIASLPDRVRGYEHLKLERATAYRDELQRRVEAFVN